MILSSIFFMSLQVLEAVSLWRLTQQWITVVGTTDGRRDLVDVNLLWDVDCWSRLTFHLMKCLCQTHQPSIPTQWLLINQDGNSCSIPISFVSTVGLEIMGEFFLAACRLHLPVLLPRHLTTRGDRDYHEKSAMCQCGSGQRHVCLISSSRRQSKNIFHLLGYTATLTCGRGTCLYQNHVVNFQFSLYSWSEL